MDVLRQVVKVVLPTSVSDVLTGGNALYPLPAGDVLNLNLPRANHDVSIHDFLGRPVNLSSVVSAGKISWNTSYLAPGIYFVRLKGKESRMLRFIK